MVRVCGAIDIVKHHALTGSMHGRQLLQAPPCAGYYSGSDLTTANANCSSLTKASPGDCAAACTANDKCVAWSFDTSGGACAGSCYLKFAVAPCVVDARFTSGVKPSSGSSAGSTCTDKDAVLALHNSYRARHVATGPLTWSNALASSAQTWADNLASTRSCDLVHSTYESRGGSGENLYGICAWGWAHACCVYTIGPAQMAWQLPCAVVP